MAPGTPNVALVAWAEGDAPLLERLLGDPSMMEHLGGPESAEQIEGRHRRYAADPGRLYKVVADGEDAGWVGYWERAWRGETVFEMGWAAPPEHQGRGVASQAVGLTLARGCAKEVPRHPVHAFSNLDNAASNALCRRAGFRLLGPCRFEYPPGRWIECNDWVMDRSGWMAASP